MDEADLLARRYAVLIVPHPDGHGYLADVPDFPYVCAGGATPAEALASAYDGIASILAVDMADGDPIPVPSARLAVAKAP